MAMIHRLAPDHEFIAGGDATGAFEDVGHSKDARDMRDSYYIGDIEEASLCLSMYPTKNIFSFI